MFSKGIYSTMLTSSVADNLFSNIIASNTLDASFLATLRALLRTRLPQDETVWLTCNKVQRSGQEILNATTLDCMNWFIPDLVRYSTTSSGHCIYIIYAPYADAGRKMLEIVKANAGAGKRYMSNYARRDDLRVFYARKATSLFYTDDAGKNTVIFTDKLELKHFHALQMMIPKYLPSLFADTPLTEAEINLLKSTGGKSAIDYERLIEGFAKEFDIRAEIIRSKLAGFETVFERMRVDELRKELAEQQNEYAHYLSMMREVSSRIQERQYLLAGLECVIKEHSEDSELMEYFMCNKNLTLIRVAGTAIDFIAHGYADIYDLDAFEQYIPNYDGYMYSQLSSDISKPQMELLYRAIFGECKYKLRICAAFTADIKTELIGRQDYSFQPESRTYFPNPHIQGYGCIGTYAGRFMEYMQKRDYVGGIDQAMVSARNLNFYDSTVMANFAKDFSRTSISCLEKPDGTLLTPREAITELEGGA